MGDLRIVGRGLFVEACGWEWERKGAQPIAGAAGTGHTRSPGSGLSQTLWGAGFSDCLWDREEEPRIATAPGDPPVHSAQPC